MKDKSCFVIMPISDNANYDSGHFDRVYEYLIKPAVLQAGLNPIRADSIKKTNYIMIDVLKRLIESDMAVCDLSSKNPNVLYELGIRQAFDKPVTLIKDDITDRIFDIQGFRDFEYDSTLRIDTVEKEREKLTEIIENTLKNEPKEVNSIVDLLSIQKASVENELKISPELSVILKSIENIDSKLSKLQDSRNNISDNLFSSENETFPISELKDLKVGDDVIHKRFGQGKLIKIEGKLPNLKGTVIFDGVGEKQLLLKFSGLGKINNKA